VKLLFDQNLSRKLPVHLADLYPDSTQAIAAGLEHRPDTAIWDHAKRHSYIIARDDDFEKLSERLGFPPKNSKEVIQVFLYYDLDFLSCRARVLGICSF
jgi:predicted nuclease of predicted toxin-antitoxin system